MARHGGDLYFTSGPGTRKAGNLAANPACTIAVKLPGMDLPLQGGRRLVAAVGEMSAPET